MLSDGADDSPYTVTGIPLAEKSRDEVLAHVRRLWGYDVRLDGVDAESGEIRYEASTGKDEEDEEGS